MHRLLEEKLKTWKNDPFRIPLLFRGARQVGKSYLAEKFGKEHFESFVSINLEANPEFCGCFTTLDPKEIIEKMELLVKQPIIPGKTLLFLDEIQACPRAITAIRYFKEKMPNLHLIGAGSLLEFAFQKGDHSFPVGRVEFIYVKPLSFSEYLIEADPFKLPKLLSDASINTPISDVAHDLLMKYIQQYFLLGGMPAAIATYLRTNSFLKAQEVQSIILNVYQSDFNKYARETQHKYLRALFEKIPVLIGTQLKYSKVDPDAKAKDLKMALEMLVDAGIVHCVFSTSGSGIPLKAHQKQNKFKTLFLDVGLINQINQVDPQKIWEEDLTQINAGMLAEQFVGQELLAHSEFYQPRDLYYWERDQQGSEAEVDYLFPSGPIIIPIEVKAGKTGKLRSLYRFLKEKKAPFGVRISQAPLSYEKNILSVPFYLMAQLPRLIQETLTSL